MSRFPTFILPLLVLVTLAAFVTPAVAVEAKGAIKSVAPDKNEFILTDSNAKDWTFQTGKDTKVMLNDKEAKLADLQSGDEATVNYERKDDKLVVTEVRCTRK